jgi:hypothetical protein
MTLSEFATITTAISSIAVTVSLIYLILQTQQSVRHTRALIQQGASARTVAIVLANQMPDASAVWCLGNGRQPTPDVVRKGQFHLMCQTSITALEDIYNQHKDGLMKEEVFARNCYVHRGLLSEPGYREYWTQYRTDIAKVAPQFSAFVDSLCTDDATEFKFKV